MKRPELALIAGLVGMVVLHVLRTRGSPPARTAPAPTVAPPTDELSGHRGRRSREMTVAIITATAAVAGALVGGAATYVSNFAVTDRQLRTESAREQRVADRAALGTARLIQADLFLAAITLDTMAEEQRFLRSPQRIRLRVSRPDMQRVAARLTSKDWGSVAEADAILTYTDNLMARHRGEHVDEGAVESWRISIERIQEAAKALSSLARHQPDDVHDW